MSLQYKPETARRRLKNADPVMSRLIALVGPFKLDTEFGLSPFEALLRAIVYQQLSGKSAAAIHARVTALFKGKLTPAALLATDENTLRKVGLSRAKVLAVHDLAAKRLDGTVPGLTQLQRMSDVQIIEQLCRVRGVGRWSVEMMLIHKLGRADVLPVHDLGIRKGYQLAYATQALPKPAELQVTGERWAPYRSVAAWYLWRATDSVDWAAV